MENNTVITIGRQFGSGGREVGIHLSQKLNIPFYDKEIISLTSKKININEEEVEVHDEKSPGSIISLGSLFSFYEKPIPDKIFFGQKEVINELAEKSSCVIVGRCADYVLKDFKDKLSVFICAPIEARIERKKQILTGFSNEDLKQHILQIDKKRSIYYGYYTEQVWSFAETYDICIDSSKFGIDGCVDLIIHALSNIKK